MKVRDGGTKDGWKMEGGQGEKRVEGEKLGCCFDVSEEGMEWKGKQGRVGSIPVNPDGAPV